MIYHAPLFYITVFYLLQLIILVFTFKSKANYVIKSALFYYLVIVTLLPAFLYVENESASYLNDSYYFFALNNFFILLSLVVYSSVRLRKKNNSQFLYPNRETYAFGLGILSAFLIFSEVLLIAYGKPHLVVALLDNSNFLIVRTTSREYPYVLTLLNSLVNPLEYVAIAGIVTCWLNNTTKSKILPVALLVLLVYFSLGTFRKSAILQIGIILSLSIVIRLGFSNIVHSIGRFLLRGKYKKKYTVHVLAIACILMIFLGFFKNYSTSDEGFFSSIIERIFIDEMSNVPAYVYMYSPFDCCDLSVLPSQGGSLWGVKDNNLEQQLFQDLYPHRGERYGNLPVLGVVSSSKAFGLLFGAAVALIGYLSFISIALVVDDLRDQNSEKKIFIETSLSILFMTIFAGGLFRVFSPFTGLSISVLASLVAVYLVSRKYVLKLK